jgi:hypothetical protein
MQKLTVTVTNETGVPLGSVPVQLENGENWTDAIAAAYDDLGF